MQRIVSRNYNAYVLRRDISAGNIIIYNNSGLLIDWDMSKGLDLTSDDKIMSLTVGYISCIFSLLCLPPVSILSGYLDPFNHFVFPISKRSKKDQAQLVHGRLDDLESFYHLLFWVSPDMHDMNSARSIFMMI